MAFEVRYSRSGTSRLALLAGAGMLLGIVMLTAPWAAVQAIGALSVLAGTGALMLAGSFRMLDGPAVRVDDKGIFYHRWSLQTVPWDNIARADWQSVLGQRVLALQLHDRDASRPDTLYGLFCSAVPLAGRGHILISWQALDCSPDDVMAALAHYGGGQEADLAPAMS